MPAISSNGLEEAASSFKRRSSAKAQPCLFKGPSFLKAVPFRAVSRWRRLAGANILIFLEDKTDESDQQHHASEYDHPMRVAHPVKPAKEIHYFAFCLTFIRLNDIRRT
jgi:hypothetical protein